MQIAKCTSSPYLTNLTRLARPAMAAVDKPVLSVNGDGFVAFSIRSLRSDGVRIQPGIPFGFPSEDAFAFAGILTGPPAHSAPTVFDDSCSR
jgi:hypothetical protein